MNAVDVRLSIFSLDLLVANPWHQRADWFVEIELCRVMMSTV